MAVYTTQKSGPMASAQGVLGADPTQEQATQNQSELQQQSESALEQQRQFNEQAAGMQGYQNITDVYGQQAALADQLRQMAMGQGPNPAAEQLRKTTQQNIETQKALMAGQRGAGANVGALQRRMGQQAAATGQTGASQENILNQQQQIAAMDALQQQQGLMGNMATGQAGMYQQALANLMGGTQNLQGLSQQQLQALISYQLGQRGLTRQQEIGEKGLDLARQSGDMKFYSDIVKAGVGGAAGVTSGAYSGSPRDTTTTGVPSGGFGMTPAGQDAWMKYANPYGRAKGGEIKEYSEGGPVYADSSNQSAILKEHYDKLPHYAEGDIVDPQGSQSALIQAMKAQQASQAAIGGQQDIVNKAAGMRGMQNMSDVFGRQQELAGQLGQLSRGEGPNPALAQLQQAAGQGIESQAAAMAGQRGSAGNVGLMASQIGRQGSAAQQQLMGQGAGMAAEQQMRGVSALQRQQGEMGKLSGAQAGLEAGGTEALMKGTQSLQGLNQQQLQNTYQNELQQRDQDIKYGLQLKELKLKQEQMQRDFWFNIVKTVAKGTAAIAMTVATGGAAAPAAAALMTLAKGGEVPKYAEGGDVMPQSQRDALKEHYSEDEPMSDVSRMLLYGSITPRMASGGMMHDMRAGGHVPGKPNVGGAVDSYSNDTVPAMLSPGEIVLPRSVTQSANPVEAAKKFVAAIKAKKGK